MAERKRPQQGEPSQKRKRGFRVGPQLPRGVYRGHLEKAKKTLIHKAKVKKEYHKALKEAGYEQEGGKKDEAAADDVEQGERNESRRKGKATQQTASPLRKKQPPKPKLTPAQVEQLKQDRDQERKEWHKKTAKGQPRLGKQTELLLSKIQRSMS